MFSGTDLVMVPHAVDRAATVLITLHQISDVGIRHAEAFYDILLAA
ncbi:MAG: hypothetical protein P8Q48_04235 [Paracoccaceae bacterium]|nr:hypothetical protein [Paracoccaceae bacterium]